MQSDLPLPPGQRPIQDFPRFGLTKFAHRFPKHANQMALHVGGEVVPRTILEPDFGLLKRVNLVSDFHCVTTWTKRRLQWSGFRFEEFYTNYVQPRSAANSISHALLRGQDGYKTSMLVTDLLNADVLLADRLNDEPLSIAHGAPLRLVAPAHYGYKNVKHLKAIEFYSYCPDYTRAAFKFMDHPRARVALEERGETFPGWFLRTLYRPLIKPTIRRFAQALTGIEA